MVAWFRDVARRRERKKFHQGHHTGIGTRVAGTVISHEQQFQPLLCHSSYRHRPSRESGFMKPENHTMSLTMYESSLSTEIVFS